MVAEDCAQIVELGNNRQPPLRSFVLHNEVWAFLMLSDYPSLGPFSFSTPEFNHHSAFRSRDGHAQGLQNMQRLGNGRQRGLQLMLSVEDCLEKRVISVPRTVLLAPFHINVMHGQGGEQCPYTRRYTATLADASLAVYAVRVLFVL